MGIDRASYRSCSRRRCCSFACAATACGTAASNPLQRLHELRESYSADAGVMAAAVCVIFSEPAMLAPKKLQHDDGRKAGDNGEDEAAIRGCQCQRRSAQWGPLPAVHVPPLAAAHPPS